MAPPKTLNLCMRVSWQKSMLWHLLAASGEKSSKFSMGNPSSDLPVGSMLAGARGKAGGVEKVESQRTRQVLLESVYALRKYDVSWVALLYDGDDGSGLSDVRAIALANDVEFYAYDARPAASTATAFYPKFALHVTLTRFASDYDYVMLPDADISFWQFNWLAFWRLHRLAGAPLVSQPLIQEGTQEPEFYVNA